MSQRTQILQYLRAHGHITPLTALRDLGVMRLAARIEELRTKGHLIETCMTKHGRKKYATYVLDSDDADPAADR